LKLHRIVGDPVVREAEYTRLQAEARKFKPSYAGDINGAAAKLKWLHSAG
jgi:hypothetical protein